MGGDPHTKAYFDSIETEDYQMPPSFTVEIRMQDNTVSYKHNYLLFYIQNMLIFYRLNV